MPKDATGQLELFIPNGVKVLRGVLLENIMGSQDSSEVCELWQFAYVRGSAWSVNGVRRSNAEQALTYLAR